MGYKAHKEATRRAMAERVSASDMADSWLMALQHCLDEGVLDRDTVVKIQALSAMCLRVLCDEKGVKLDVKDFIEEDDTPLDISDEEVADMDKMIDEAFNSLEQAGVIEKKKIN